MARLMTSFCSNAKEIKKFRWISVSATAAIHLSIPNGRNTFESISLRSWSFGESMIKSFQRQALNRIDGT